MPPGGLEAAARGTPRPVPDPAFALLAAGTGRLAAAAGRVVGPWSAPGPGEGALAAPGAGLVVEVPPAFEAGLVATAGPRFDPVAQPWTASTMPARPSSRRDHPLFSSAREWFRLRADVPASRRCSSVSVCICGRGWVWGLMAAQPTAVPQAGRVERATCPLRPASPGVGAWSQCDWWERSWGWRRPWGGPDAPRRLLDHDPGFRRIGFAV